MTWVVFNRMVFVKCIIHFYSTMSSHDVIEYKSNIIIWYYNVPIVERTDYTQYYERFVSEEMGQMPGII